MSVYTDPHPPDTGYPLPEGHPEFAACSYCGHTGRASLMYNAGIHGGKPDLYCLEMKACTDREADARDAQAAAALHAGDDPFTVPDEAADEAGLVAEGCEQ